MKSKTMFQKLKKNQLVRDSGYGDGKVIRKTQRSAYIELFDQKKVQRYDREHVNHFIRPTIKGEK